MPPKKEIPAETKAEPKNDTAKADPKPAAVVIADATQLPEYAPLYQAKVAAGLTREQAREVTLAQLREDGVL